MQSLHWICEENRIDTIDLSRGNYLQTLIYYKHLSYNYIYIYTHTVYVYICVCMYVYKVELPDVWLIGNLTDCLQVWQNIWQSFRSAYSLIKILCACILCNTKSNEVNKKFQWILLHTASGLQKLCFFYLTTGFSF